MMNITDIISLLKCNTCIVALHNYATGDSSYVLETYHNRNLTEFPDTIPISSGQFSYLYSLDYIIADSFLTADNTTLYIWFEYNPYPITYKSH